MVLANLARIALENELSGLECMAGIPGTVGGAVRMNAGAFGKEMKDIVIHSVAMDQNGEIQELDGEAHQFQHRKSIFEENGWILLETTLQLSYGEKAKIQNKMEECKKKRLEKQPLEYPSAGSVFKRNEDIPTAKLIEDCGLKGYAVGGAEISTKHSGFIINKGNATANDVLTLIEIIQNKVREKFAKEIELEILVIGEEIEQ